ncbi:MAG: amidohydrolase [Chlorobi bacterium]|nr:amidohydrolase [Chlorobiota bacterium]
MILRIAGSRIESVETSEKNRFILNGTDLSLSDNALILPGFVDTHCHLIGPGMMAERVDLRDANSATECLERTAREAKGRRPEEWIIGFGWNQEGWNDLDAFHKNALDSLAPNNPIVLYRIDTHAAWLNTQALQAAGIYGGSVIEGGEVRVDADGEPTGLLIDNAVKVLELHMPSFTSEQIIGWYRYGIEECLRYGITEVHDMTVHHHWLEPMTQLAESGGMSIRCNAFLDGENQRWRAVPVPRNLGPNLEIVGVKFFSDGALGSRGAYLLEPYNDAPDTYGIRMMETEEIVVASREPLEAGYGIAIHAIGDGANRLVLDAYEGLRPVYPDALLRIEHAQIVHPDDVPRFAALNVIPTIQPTHCTSDAKMAEARLGEERCLYAYGWRSLREHGAPLLGGSDFPIESPDPLLGLRAFVNREALSGAWYPEQRISRTDALRAYTEWPPLGLPQRPNRGRLEPGCNADLVVLSGDPFEDDDVRVVMTIVRGKVCYRE